MPTTEGNAVNAKWVGPDGMQLWDGTILHKGDVVLDIGYDEAHGSEYWEPVASIGDATVAPVPASSLRDDWSFGVEEGGGATGRPEIAGQEQAAPAPAAPAPTPTVTPPAKADDGGTD